LVVKEIFLSQIEASEIFTILDIDSQTPAVQAFLSADRTYNKSTVKLFFYSKNQSECHSKVATLLPYLLFTNPSLEKGIRQCFSAEANKCSKGVKWDPVQKEVITVDNEIFESYALNLDSEDEAENPNDKLQKIRMEFAAEMDQPTKVQEGDAASLFSQSTFWSKKKLKTMVALLTPMTRQKR
jgi:SPX domain protein involved in polyphosphate accumulation